MNAARDYGGGPAFPVNTENVATPGAFEPWPGLSKREWFAGQALAGLLARMPRDAGCDWYAAEAFAFADAMITEGAK